MEILLGVLMAIGFIFLVFFTRIFTTLIHELGHAIPSLMFTEGEVAIHVGSYGDDKNSFKIDFGRLKAFFKIDIVKWNIGLCQHQPAKTYLQNILIVLGGPIFSVLIGIVLIYLLEVRTWSDEVTFIFAFFIFSSVWDFIANMVPSKESIMMHDGSANYNDGFHLMQLMKESKLPPTYFEGVDFLNKKKFDSAVDSFQKVITEGHDKKEIHLLLASSFIGNKKYSEALEIFLNLLEKKQLDISEYPLLGNLYMEMNEYAKAINIYNPFLFKFYNNPIVLNNRAYCFLQIGEYEKAIHDLDSALFHDPKCAYAFNNRGLAKIRLGQTDEGLADIEKSKSLDDSNAYVFLHLGYYFQKINQPQKAHEQFQKAKEMEIDFHGIDYLIETTRENNF